jgi:hypothetical protein
MAQTDKGLIVGSVIAGICAIMAAIIGAILTGYFTNKGNSNKQPADNPVVLTNKKSPENSNQASPNRLKEISTITLSRQRNNQITRAQLSDVFTKDDGISLQLKTTENGFLYFFYKGSDGDSRISLSNKQPENNQIRIEGGQTVRIPSEGWWFFDGKKGVEQVYLVFSKTADKLIGQDEATGQQVTIHDTPEEVVDFLEKIHGNKSGDTFTTPTGIVVRVITLLHQ